MHPAVSPDGRQIAFAALGDLSPSRLFVSQGDDRIDAQRAASRNPTTQRRGNGKDGAGDDEGGRVGW
jgi:hypothetical protein